MLKLLAPLVVLLALVAVVIGSDRPRSRADFTFVNHSEINTLDPLRMSWMQDLRVGRMLFETLVRCDLTGPEPVIRPAAAESWTIAEDRRTYTFTLRPGARWSSGEPVRAGDFVYAWRRALLPDQGCDYTAVFQLIEGAKEFYEWRRAKLEAFANQPASERNAQALWAETERAFTETVKLRAVDDRTLTFTLRRPVPYFMDMCAFPVLSPVNPGLLKTFEALDRDTGRLTIRSGWTKAGVLVGNGPFVLSGWRFKRDMDFARSPTYWDRQRVRLATVRILCIEDPSAQVLAARGGGGGSDTDGTEPVDWLTEVAAPYRADMVAERRAFDREHAAKIEAMRARGMDQPAIDAALPSDAHARDRVHVLPAFGTYFYSFNCQDKLPDGRDNPFKDKRVRRAFALALDKDRIASQVRRLGEPVASTLIPRGSIAGYESPNGLGHDPAEAKRLLAEAGYPGGKGLPTIQVLFTRDAGHEVIGQSAKKDWEEVLGASVELVTREVKVFRNDVRRGNFMVARSSWFGDHNDPATFLDISRTGDGNNDRKYSSKEYDRLLDAADVATSKAERLAIMSKAEKLLVEDDLPILPVFQYVEIYVYDPHRVRGLIGHPRLEQDVSRMWVGGAGEQNDSPQRHRGTETNQTLKHGVHGGHGEEHGMGIGFEPNQLKSSFSDLRVLRDLRVSTCLGFSVPLCLCGGSDPGQGASQCSA